MKQKKNNVITFRVDDEIKQKLDEISREKEWSISQVVEKICKEYLKEKSENNGNNMDT